jgi:hypothetical protein
VPEQGQRSGLLCRKGPDRIFKTATLPALDQYVIHTAHYSDSQVVNFSSFNRGVEGLKGARRIRTEIKQGNLRPVEKTTVLEANAGVQDRLARTAINDNLIGHRGGTVQADYCDDRIS